MMLEARGDLVITSIFLLIWKINRIVQLASLVYNKTTKTCITLVAADFVGVQVFCNIDGI